eukprot:COSAG01_NODE_6906_length_3444_cov_8.863677_3_plen_171_part_00
MVDACGLHCRAVSHLCACIGSPCLRQRVHGAPMQTAGCAFFFVYTSGRSAGSCFPKATAGGKLQVRQPTRWPKGHWAPHGVCMLARHMCVRCDNDNMHRDMHAHTCLGSRRHARRLTCCSCPQSPACKPPKCTSAFYKMDGEPVSPTPPPSKPHNGITANDTYIHTIRVL